MMKANLANVMKQAQQMQENMKTMQDQLANKMEQNTSLIQQDRKNLMVRSKTRTSKMIESSTVSLKERPLVNSNNLQNYMNTVGITLGE